MAAATTSSPNTSPQRPKALLEVTIGRSRTPPTTFVLGLGQPGCDPPRRGILVPILRVAGTPPGIFLRGSSSPLGPVQPAEPRTHAASGSRYRRKGAYRSGPFHRGQRHTDHRLDDEPSSASRAVASPSPSIAARQPRSAQSCCATAPAAARRVEVVVLAVILILLFSDVHRFVPATTSYVSALAVARLCAQTVQDAIYRFCALCSRTDAGTVASLTDPGRALSLSVAHRYAQIYGFH